MTHASLFTGIGGFDLAAEWMGWHNIFQVEINDYCQKILQRRFPNAKKYSDVKEFRGGQFAGSIDVLSGGFPCKQTSVAAAIHGRRSGLEGYDSRLWYEELRIIDETQPDWAPIENVSGVAKWESVIQKGLESIGYSVSRLESKASYFGLPHRRQRYIYVANRDGQRLESTRCKESPTIEWYQRLATSGGSWLQHTPGDGRGIDGVSNRVDRINAIGNAITPFQALDVFKAIQEYENLKNGA